ncbi:uncharacterized protein LOC124414444 [Diprion similis]|uniref:uncharacterized protein LOC124414444 n=1 Tax=Diprion similis TaxID=362088 RepID=UPI001EF93FA8|nr:uncharacterized protein LOC124414444 [Diprion similis]
MANGDKGTDETPDEEDQKKDKKEEEQKKEEERKSKERKKWRKEPGPCKDNYGSVSKAALNAKGTRKVFFVVTIVFAQTYNRDVNNRLLFFSFHIASASTRTEELAKPHIHVSTACRDDAFGVKKSALSGSASARVSEMAKPNHPADPVERPPPREKNAFGAPIFPQPKFGKRLPKVKPYKMGECKDKDNKDKGKANESENSMKKYESVPLYPSIDPCIDPAGAKKQAKARKAAEEAKKARREKRRQKQQAKSDQVKQENNEKNK